MHFQKKKQKLKLAVVIISSNLFVALICLSLNSSPAMPPPSPAPTKTIHPNYKMIVVPLTLLIEVNPLANETPVTLMTKSKKILINKAYLNEQVKNNDGTAEREQSGPPHFKIEIPENEVLKLSADTEVLMIAIPELKLPIDEKNYLNKRVSHYEIDL